MIAECSGAFDPRASAGLFVGISNFEDERINAVPFAVDDAVDLAHLFTLELGLILPERIILLLAGDPRKPESMDRLAVLIGRGARRRSARMRDVYRYLGEMARSTEERGLFVLTAATHGVSDQGGDFLVATDSLKERTLRTGIAVDELFDDVSRAGAERRLVLLDACRERFSQGTRGEAESAMTQSFAGAIARTQGSVILSASTLGGFAYDDQERKNGVFTAAVLDGLHGEAKATVEGWITVQTLADFVQQRVAGWVRRNRPDHAAKSLGIARRIEATAEGLPLASHPEAIRDRRRYRVRREAALARVKENQGRVLTGALWDHIVVLLPEQKPSPEAERLLEEIEALDNSERSQRSLRDFLRELSGGVNQASSSRKQLGGTEETGQEARPTTGRTEIDSSVPYRQVRNDQKKAKSGKSSAPVGNNSAPVFTVRKNATPDSEDSSTRPSRAIHSKVNRAPQLFVMLALVVLLGVLAWLSIIDWRTSSSTVKPESSTQSRVDRSLGGRISTARDLRELSILQDFEARKWVGVRLLVGIVEALPNLLWLDRLTLNASRISIEGKSYNANAIANFIENLDKMDGFSEPVLERTEERQGGLYFFALAFEREGLPAPQSMTGLLEKERGRLLLHLAGNEKVNEVLTQIHKLLEEAANIKILEFKAEARQEADDRIEIVPLSLKLRAASTRQLVLLLDQLEQLSKSVSLKRFLISRSEKEIVADLLLEIPTLKVGVQPPPPATAEPEQEIERFRPKIPNFSREPLRILLAEKEISPRISETRPEGVPGLLIGEIELTGLFQTSKGFVAQVVYEDQKKSYLLKEGDQLYDGEVVSISREQIVFKQIVKGSSAPRSFREVTMNINRP